MYYFLGPDENIIKGMFLIAGNIYAPTAISL